MNNYARRCWILFLAIGSVSYVHGQQDPLYALYLNNPLLINPAYSGTQKNLTANLSFRKQWTGLDGSPTTLNASGHISLDENRMGAGLIVVQDQLGNQETTEIMGTYAYHLPLSEGMTLSFGLQAGLSAYNSKGSELLLYDAGDPVFNGTQNYSTFNIGTGALLRSDRFMVGFSIPRMLKASGEIDTLKTSIYTQHVYITGSYIFLLNEQIKFKPSALLRSVPGAPLSLDLNATLIFYEKISAGVLTRNFNTFGLLGAYRINPMFRVAYVFELPTGSSVGAQFTNHELSLIFNTAVLPWHDATAFQSY